MQTGSDTPNGNMGDCRRPVSINGLGGQCQVVVADTDKEDWRKTKERPKELIEKEKSNGFSGFQER